MSSDSLTNLMGRIIPAALIGYGLYRLMGLLIFAPVFIAVACYWMIGAIRRSVGDQLRIALTLLAFQATLLGLAAFLEPITLWETWPDIAVSTALLLWCLATLSRMSVYCILALEIVELAVNFYLFLGTMWIDPSGVALILNMAIRVMIIFFAILALDAGLERAEKGMPNVPEYHR